MFSMSTVYTMSQMLWSGMLKKEGVVQVNDHENTNCASITGHVQPGDDL